jgi:hypothetical protein
VRLSIRMREVQCSRKGTPVMDRPTLRVISGPVMGGSICSAPLGVNSTPPCTICCTAVELYVTAISSLYDRF